MEQRICQSCAMPLQPSDYGTNKDGTPNETYCKYCYENGAFTGETTLQEMIDLCVPHMATPESGLSAEEARAMMEKVLPQLERWKKA